MRPDVFQAHEIFSAYPPPLSDYGRRLLAEGDSWFTIGTLNLPRSSNILLNLEFRRSTAVVSCAYPGHTLQHMVDNLHDPYFDRFLRQPNFSSYWEAVLISGGGNDLIDAAQTPSQDGQGQPVPAEGRLLLTATEVAANTTAQGAARYVSEAGWNRLATYLRGRLPGPDVTPDQLRSRSWWTGAEVFVLVDDYDLVWQDYLGCGGFPRAVAEYQRTGAVGKPYQRDLLAWLRADVDPDAPLESVPQLLVTLMERMTSPLDQQKTAAVAGFSSREAFGLRLQRLVNSHALLRCRHRLDDGRAVPRAQAKLYLTDPLLAWLPSALSPGLPRPAMTSLSEMVLAVALARAVDGLEEGRWVADDTIGYCRTSSGNEIDFSPVRVPTEAGAGLTTPIESKWVDDGWRREALVLEGRYGRGVMATKSILDLTHPSWAIPAPLVACLLG